MKNKSLVLFLMILLALPSFAYLCDLNIFQDENHTTTANGITFYGNRSLYWKLNCTPTSYPSVWYSETDPYLKIIGSNEAQLPELLWYSYIFANGTDDWAGDVHGETQLPDAMECNDCKQQVEFYHVNGSREIGGVTENTFALRGADIVFPVITLDSVATNESRSWIGTNDTVTINLTLTEQNPDASKSSCNVTNPNNVQIETNVSFDFSFNNTSWIGNYSLRCYAEDMVEQGTSALFGFQVYDSICGAPPENARLELYYPPYSVANDTHIVRAYYTDGNYPIMCANVSFGFDGTITTMNYVQGYESYVVSFTPEAWGNSTFNVSAGWNESYNISGFGLMRIKNPFTVKVSLWERDGSAQLDREKTNRFIDDFGSVFLYNASMMCEPMVGNLLYNENFSLGTEWTHSTNRSGEGCYFHAPYEEGIAEVQVWETGKYEIWFIDKRTAWFNDFSRPVVQGDEQNLEDPDNLYYEMGRKLHFIDLSESGVSLDMSLFEETPGLDIYTRLNIQEVDETNNQLDFWVSHFELNPLGFVWMKMLALGGIVCCLFLTVGLVAFADFSIKEALGLSLALCSVLGIFAVSIGW